MLSSFSFTATTFATAVLFRTTSAIQKVTPTMEDCNIDWAESWQSGISGASGKWCASQIKQGHLISGFRFFSGGGPKHSRIDGMDVIYTNGDWTQIGRTDGWKAYKSELYWDPYKVSVTKVNTVPANIGWNQHHRDVRVLLSDGRKVLAGEGMYHGDQGQYESHGPTDIHGTLVGVSGQTGTYGLESVTYHYINSPAKKAVLHDIVTDPSFTDLNGRSKLDDRGMHNSSIIEGYYYNKYDQDVTFHVKSILRYTTKTQYSHTSGDTGGLGGSETVEFEGGLPLIAKNKASTAFTWDWKHSSEQMDGWEKTDEVHEEIWVDVPVKSKKAVYVAGMTMLGSLDVKYSAMQTITLENGKKAEIPISGQLSAAQCSSSWWTTENAEPAAMLAALKNGVKPFNDQGEIIGSDGVIQLLETTKGIGIS